MARRATIPNPSQAIAAPNGTPTHSWYNWLLALDALFTASDAGMQAQITAIALALGSPDGTVERIPPLRLDVGNVIGQASIRSLGLLANGSVFLSLEGDEVTPGTTHYYGTNSSGEKGWFPVADTLQTSTLSLSVDPVTGVISVDLPDLPNSGVGSTLVKITRDSKGRVEGSEQASAEDLPVASLPGATYSTLQDYINTMGSPGSIDGPAAGIVDLGAGNIRVLAGKGMIRPADDDVSTLAFFNWPQADFVQPADGKTWFYGVVYNAGTPIVQQRAAFTWDLDTEIPLGSAARFASGATIVTPNPYRTGDPITNIIQRFDAQSPAVRDNSVGGLILGNSGRGTRRSRRGQSGHGSATMQWLPRTAPPRRCGRPTSTAPGLRSQPA